MATFAGSIGANGYGQLISGYGGMDDIGNNMVGVEIRRHTALLPAEVLDTVRAALTARPLPTFPRDRSHPDQHDAGCRVIRRRKHSLVSISAGLVPRVVQRLTDDGYEVTVTDRTQWLQFRSVNTSLVSRLTDYLGGILAAVHGSPRGRIAVAGQSDVHDIIPAMANFFHHENILVVAKNRATAARLASTLQNQVRVPVTCNSNYEWRNGPQVHVDNIAGFEGRSVTDWGVVVFADAESALSERSSQQAACMDESLMYAIVPSDYRFDVEDQLRLEAVCGPEIYRAQDDAYRFTKVKVYALAPGSYPAERERDPLSRKRTNIWHNVRRNQPIAESAQALRTRDWRKLQRLGVDVGPEGIGQLTETVDGDNIAPSVTVLVETPEHGQALRKLMPGWQLLDALGSDSDVAGVMDDYSLLFQPDRSIMTLCRARQSGIAADVIIRADGGAGAWHPDFGPHTCLNGPEMLVVDFMDDFDEQAIRDEQRRVRDYEELDWSVTGYRTANGAGPVPSTVVKPSRHGRGRRRVSIHPSPAHHHIGLDRKGGKC